MAKCSKGGEDIIEMTTDNCGNSPVQLPISKEKKDRVSELLAEMSKLTDLEKIYMHLKLPACPIIEDESDSPPSGSASRASTTLNWIQSHYVEDRRVCLPKQEVYSHYKLYCDTNGTNPFAMAEFGKIMKTAFPSVHDRRLGQRGKSKYFYGGLRRKSSYGDTSDPESNKIEDQQLLDHEEELESLSSQLVCEWASCLLGKNFSSVKSLAHYLVFSGASCGKKATLFNMLLDMDGLGSSCAAQDTQALLQRKIHQKEVLKEHKNLLKQYETKQKDTQATHPTAARLAVLSPSLHALHSTDASNFHPSRLHVLNVARNNSASSVPILSARQENSEALTDFVSVKSASVTTVGFTCIVKSDKTKMCSNQSESLDINKNISTPDVEHQIDKEKSKNKQSKLISSKSLEESSQRQPKRNGDFLYNANQGQNSKRRRCITSLGMAGLMEQSSESIEQGHNSQKESTITRPVSCPVFNGDLQTFVCGMESDDIETTSVDQVLQISKEADSVSDLKISPSHNDDGKIPSPFHFVRKPTVISIKPPELSEGNDISNSGESDNVSPEKKPHRIINSILSSSDSNIPHNFSSATKTSSSLAQPLCSDSQTPDNSCDSDKLIRREAHTLDNAYLLPCQSSRSAFVRVMNGKGHKRSEIIPRPRHLSFNSSSNSGCAKQNANGDKLDANGKLLEPKSAVEMSRLHNDPSSIVVKEDTDQCPGDDFKSISVPSSSNDRVPSTVFDITKGGMTETTRVPLSAESTLSNVESLQSLSVQLTSPTITSPIHSKRLTSKSPVTPPKRYQSRSRFTPIRPKIGGCCNQSPQKKDMRPVATILKEQRARSAQELLVNLASSYQGGIKVQLPTDLFGLSADKTANTIPSILSSQGNQNIPCSTALVLEPVSLSNPITTQASPIISPQKMICSTSNVTMTSPISSTLSDLLTGGARASETASVSVPSNYQSGLKPSSNITSPTLSIPCQSLESPIAVGDVKGAVCNLGNADAGKPLSKVSSLQQLLQGSAGKINPLSSTLSQQNLINFSDIKGHVLGSDTCGQTFLLVPNSESTKLPTNHHLLGTSTNLVSTFSSPKQRQPLISRLTPGVSSAALLSELSQLASVNETCSKQPIIKHDSTVSAFQKCEPNKSIIDINSDNKTEPKTGVKNQTIESVSPMPLLRGQTSNHRSMSCDEMSDGQEMESDVCLRKRKASKGHDEKLNEKKRHNTVNTEGDDLVFVKADEDTVEIQESKEAVCIDNLLTSKETGDINFLKSNDGTNVSDTEALLSLIDSRSMTVKQTVMAMNSLKAQMRKSGLQIQPAKANEDESSVNGNKVESTSLSEKSTQRTLHVTRRNTSLNLESLESDALLDTELFLDQHLVEDIKHSKNGKSDLKTSVAVAAKSHRSHSADKNKTQARHGKDHNQLPTISPKALHSYQMILSEKSKYQRDRKNDQEVPVKLTNPSARQLKENSLKGDSIVTEKKPQRRIQRRCVSSVQDILKGRSKPLPPAFDHQNSKPQSEVDVFDALLSKMYSKQLPSTKDNVARYHSSLVQDSELPIDIVDFVTESMSSRRDSLEGNSGKHITRFKSFKPPESTVARSISVPNTKPDFFDAEQAHVNLACSGFPNESRFQTEPQQLFIQPTAGDSLVCGEETGTSTAKNVFLSPIGPAKLARRSSVEKSISQGQSDRSTSRMPVELSSPTLPSQSTLNKDKLSTEVCSNGNSKGHVGERHYRTRTPVDRTLVSSAKHRSQTPVMQSVDKGYRSPVNRALAKTPIEKCFVKQSSDPLPPRSDLMLPLLSSVRREDASSAQTFVSDGGYSSGSVSQTPNSDCGRSSVSQTPISDFGYSSVSPSPVMMSSTTYLSECGRNLSPTAIFMPLRTDSALSLNNSNPRSESPSAPQTNQVDLPVFSNSSPSDKRRTRRSKDRKSRHSPHQFTAELPEFPSLLNSLSSKEESKVIKACSNTDTLLKLLTSSIQSIPTPPVSPSSSPPNNLPLPFSIPSPQQPRSEVSPLMLPLSTAPCFIPPMSSSSSSSSSHSAHNQQGRQFGPSPHFRSQDLPSPALVSHRYTPSPQILTRPPSSPHQYSSHPSPPFTPCSLRSLPSPRCMTPLSHKSLISPRSVTPSSDPSQAAPNRFMPIQSSGVLPTSQTSTHTYIQPIRPVVALASASSHNNDSNNNNFGISTSSPQSSMARSLVSLPTPQNALSNARVMYSLHSIPPMSSHSNSSSQPLKQGVDGSDAIRTSEHKPLEANSTLVLSLSGDIGPLSNQGVDSAWGNAEQSNQHKKGLMKQTHTPGKGSDIVHSSNRDDANQINGSQLSQQSSLIKSQVSSPSLCAQPHRPKPRASSSASSSVLRLPIVQPNPRLPNDGSRSLINTISSSSRAFKPPLSMSSVSPSSVDSFKPLSTNSFTTHHTDFSKLDSGQSQSQSPGRATQSLQNTQVRVDRVVSRNFTHDRRQDSVRQWVSNTSYQNLQNPVGSSNTTSNSVGAIGLNLDTQDELQATLDVLKDMDSQYFV